MPSTRRGSIGDRALPVAAARAWNSVPPVCSCFVCFFFIFRLFFSKCFTNFRLSPLTFSLLIFFHYYYLLLTIVTFTNRLPHARLLLLFNKLYCIVKTRACSSLVSDIPKEDQFSPSSSVMRLTWRCPFRPSADVRAELYNSFCRATLCKRSLCHHYITLHKIVFRVPKITKDC